MNNPILLFLVIVQLGVAFSYFLKGAYILGGIYICFSIANFLTLFIKAQ